MKSEKGSRKDANNGNFGVIGEGPQSKRERVKEARGCAEGSGNADHSEEREIGEKRCIWGKAGCMCVGALVFLGTGTRGPFHAPPQLEPSVRGEERKETCKRVPVTTGSKESEVQNPE